MTAAAEPLIGVINAGSSSLKFSFYEGERRILTGQVDGIGAHPAAIILSRSILFMRSQGQPHSIAVKKRFLAF